MIDYDRARSVRTAAMFALRLTQWSHAMQSVLVDAESLSVDAIVHCRQLIIVISVWWTSLSVDAIAV